MPSLLSSGSCVNGISFLNITKSAPLNFQRTNNFHTRKIFKPRPNQCRKNSIFSAGAMVECIESSSIPSVKDKYMKADGIVIVDHGSRRAQSNLMLEKFVALFKQKTGHENVEPAHMELAKPTIKDAFDKCVSQGAQRVIITPYFLSPGRHWDKDIPALANEAALGHPNIPYIVTAPIGIHDLMVDIMLDRINYCLSHTDGEVPECDMCAGTGRCKMLENSTRTDY